MNFWSAFFIGFVVGLLPMIYGIIRAMRMTGGDMANFSWEATKNKTRQENEKEKEIVEVEKNE